MPNKHPFYHRATILFTATEPLSQTETEIKIASAFKKDKKVIASTVQVKEFSEPEPGDPADLM